jgi:outer membrane protein assembly factor BamB
MAAWRAERTAAYRQHALSYLSGVVVWCAWLSGTGCGREHAAEPGLRSAQSPPPTALHQPPTARNDLWTRARGVDWPDFLGPKRDGRSAETGLTVSWPSGGPPLVWKREIGEGYGMGSVAGGRFFHFDRTDDRARLLCLHAETGEELWRFEYATDFVDFYGYDGGPRASPVVDDQRVYILGAEGMLHCVDASTGALIWQCDTHERFGVVPNFFGVGSTPLVEKDLLLVMVGGSPPEDQHIPIGRLDRVRGNGTGIVAFDKFSGAVRYTTSDELASYSSPVAATINGQRYCFAFCRGGLLAFDPATGKIHFSQPWRARLLESVNAATPVVVDDTVFVSEAYGPGSLLVRVTADGHDIVWRDPANARSRAMQAHFGTPVYHDGYLYGCSCRHSPNAELRCLEWATGRIMWSQPVGRWCSLLYVDQHLVSLDERGRLQLIRANPHRYELVAEAHWGATGVGVASLGDPARPLLDYPCWAAPILSHGLLYVRGQSRLVCLELIPEDRSR